MCRLEEEKHETRILVSRECLDDRKCELMRSRAERGHARRARRSIRAAIEQLIRVLKRNRNQGKSHLRLGLGTKKQVASGEAFDVPVVQPPFPEVLASGNVVASSAKTLASISIGVAVKKGAPKPDISTPDAVKKMLLAAKSIAYPNPAGGAAAGVAFDATLKQLGIADQVESKLKRAQGGAGAMKMAADGEAEIGLTFLSEMENPGIDIVDLAESYFAAHHAGRFHRCAREGSRGSKEVAGLPVVAGSGGRV